MIILENSAEEKRIQQLFREVGIERIIIDYIGKNEDEVKKAFQNFIAEIKEQYSEEKAKKIIENLDYKSYYTIAIEILMRELAEIFEEKIDQNRNPTVICLGMFIGLRKIAEENEPEMVADMLDILNQVIKDYTFI